jgi:type II secretory pathway component PulF
LRSLTQLIEPIIMIVVGVMIGTMIVVLALPFMQIFTALK